MSERYQEYKSSKRKQQKKTSIKSIYLKKLSRQLIITLVSFCTIYLIKHTDTSLANALNNKIKYAVTYNSDTSQVSEIIKALIENINEETGEKNNEKKAVPSENI